MAKLTTSLFDSSSSNYYMSSSTNEISQANIRASCYTVEVSTMALNGLQYSSCGDGGPSQCFDYSTDHLFKDSGGGFEVDTGLDTPPQSPPLAAQAYAYEQATMTKQARRKGGIAYTITEECERLFCEVLRAVFLGERDSAVQTPLVAGTHKKNNMPIERRMDPELKKTSAIGEASGRSTGHRSTENPASDVLMWFEAWDYTGGARFRGFTADAADIGKAMFVFFDDAVIGRDLKQGLMALLELASAEQFHCSQLIVCIDRGLASSESKGLNRDLGWVGFEPITLEAWTGHAALTSQRWLLMGIET